MVKKQFPEAVDYARFMAKYSRCVFMLFFCVVVADRGETPQTADGRAAGTGA